MWLNLIESRKNARIVAPGKKKSCSNQMSNLVSRGSSRRQLFTLDEPYNCILCPISLHECLLSSEQRGPDQAPGHHKTSPGDDDGRPRKCHQSRGKIVKTQVAQHDTCLGLSLKRNSTIRLNKGIVARKRFRDKQLCASAGLTCSREGACTY